MSDEWYAPPPSSPLVSDLHLNALHRELDECASTHCDLLPSGDIGFAADGPDGHGDGIWPRVETADVSRGTITWAVVNNRTYETRQF